MPHVLISHLLTNTPSAHHLPVQSFSHDIISHLSSLSLTSSYWFSWLKPSKCHIIMPGNALRQTTKLYFLIFLIVILLQYWKSQTKHRISVKIKWFVLDCSTIFQVKEWLKKQKIFFLHGVLKQLLYGAPQIVEYFSENALICFFCQIEMKRFYHCHVCMLIVKLEPVAD